MQRTKKSYLGQENAVELTHVSKVYGTHAVLRDLSLTVSKGTIYGLLGPNGAGKTTTIKMLVGALAPTQGSVSTLGFNPIDNKRAIRQRIGYMPQNPALYDNLTARQNIMFFGQLQETKFIQSRVNDMLAFADLLTHADKPVHSFSGGMKKRVSLACALIHQPEILFLDEPTAAIDPELKRRMWEQFYKLADNGVTIFVSTHLMDEALLCDQLAILHRGSIIATGTPADILRRGTTKIIVTRSDEIVEKYSRNDPADLATVFKEFNLSPDISEVQVEQESLESIILDMIKQEDI